MSDEASKAPAYLTPAQLSQRLGGLIAVRTLANWRTNGHGPKFVKLGGKVAYPLNEVEAWEAKRTVENTSQYRK